jgi:hypothetical protein
MRAFRAFGFLAGVFATVLQLVLAIRAFDPVHE